MVVSPILFLRMHLTARVTLAPCVGPRFIDPLTMSDYEHGVGFDTVTVIFIVILRQRRVVSAAL